MPSKNYVTEFGEAQLPKTIKNKKKERGHPLKETNDDNQAENWVEQGHDPHNYVRRFPDGTQIVIAYGKNPRMTVYHSSGHQINVFPDGTISMITTGNRYDMVKGGSTSTTEGHADHRGGGHARNNYEGGVYQDVAGDFAHHTAGDHASHVAGNSTTNVSGNMSIKGNKQLVVGTQDDNGQLAMSINMNNGRMQIQSKGDIEVSSKSGAIKFKGQNITLQASGDISMNADGQITQSAPTIARGADTLREPSVPVTTTSRPPEKSVHDGHASQRTAFDYTNTLNNDTG